VIYGVIKQIPGEAVFFGTGDYPYMFVTSEKPVQLVDKPLGTVE
jgi:hypothetical protein